MKSPFQTLESASCSSVLAGSGTPRSGRSAETLTASHGVAQVVCLCTEKQRLSLGLHNMNKPCTVWRDQNILKKTKKQKQI